MTQGSITSSLTRRRHADVSSKQAQQEAATSQENEIHVVENYMQEIKILENNIREWRNSSGMSAILGELKRRDFTNVDHSELVLSLAQGIEKGAEDASAAIQETSIVAALLMTFSVSALINPPEALNAYPKNDWKSILHAYAWCLMSATGGAIIMYGRMYTAAMTRAVRASDKLRIQLERNAFQDTLYMMYVMFHFFIWGVFADSVILYGLVHGIVLTVIATGVVCLASCLGFRYMSAGHMTWGWQAHRVSWDDPIDDLLLFEVLQKKSEYSKLLRRDARSVFAYPKEEGALKGPQGLSEEGRELFKDVQYVSPTRGHFN